MSLRFIFETGNCRIEEIDHEGGIINVLYADGGTIKGYFNVWKKQKTKPITLTELDKIITS